MPPINPTYGFGDVVWRFSRWLIWRPPWILEGNDFSNLNFHVVSMPPTKFDSDWVRVQTWFQEFQDRCPGGHLGCWNWTILAILNSMSLRCFLWAPSHLPFGDVFWRISRWPPSWIQRKILAFLNLLCCSGAIKFQLIQLTAMVAILDT